MKVTQLLSFIALNRLKLLINIQNFRAGDSLFLLETYHSPDNFKKSRIRQLLLGSKQRLELLFAKVRGQYPRRPDYLPQFFSSNLVFHSLVLLTGHLKNRSNSLFVSHICLEMR